MIFLDSDICVHWLRGDRTIASNIDARPSRELGVTSITACELMYGAYKSLRVENNLALLNQLFSRIGVHQTSSGVEIWYGRLKAELEQRGEALDDMDLLIASVTLQARASLATRNLKHFRKISGLHVLEW